jgi:glycosyltransferase involved in cell wall biosynthesis
MKILLVGHACSPDRGSESGLTWQFAWHLSRIHEVWVITDPQFRDEIDRYLEVHPNARLHFVWVGLPPRWDPRRPGSEKRLRLHYVFWQRAVLREARRQHRQHKFDLVHHLSWGTISAPPLLWRLPVPLVWGPVGGGQTAPPAYRRYFGSAWRREFLRTFRLKLVMRMPRLRRTVRACALILSTNPETTQALKVAGAQAVRFFPNIGVPDNLLSLSPDKQAREKSEFVVLWAGRLIPIKGLALALEALSQLDSKQPVRLRVLGDGPLRADMEKLAHTLRIAERVEFVGAVPWLQMKRYYREADIFLFTSLRDSSGAVLAEALASRLPIVTLNHQGAGAIVPAEAAIKVAVTDPDETVRNLSKAMQLLITSPELRQQMAESAAIHAQNLSWTTHAEKMTGWYMEILADARVDAGYAYAAI